MERTMIRFGHVYAAFFLSFLAGSIVLSSYAGEVTASKPTVYLYGSAR